jgi:hypothetical protein
MELVFQPERKLALGKELELDNVPYKEQVLVCQRGKELVQHISLEQEQGKPRVSQLEHKLDMGI